MGALRRILVAFGGLLSLGFTALVTAALVNHNFGTSLLNTLEKQVMPFFQGWLRDGKGLWLPMLLAALFLVVGILLLAVAFHRQRLVRQVVVDSVNGGSVLVSLNAIDNVVRRAAGQVLGDAAVNDHLRVVGDGDLHIHLEFALPTNRNLTEISAVLRKEIETQLADMMNVKPTAINITVMDIAEKGSAPKPAPVAPTRPAPAAEPKPAPAETKAAPAEQPEEAQHGLE